MLVKIISDTSIGGKHITKDSVIDVSKDVYSELFHASRAVLAPADAKPFTAPSRDFLKEEQDARAAYRAQLKGGG
jgi:hypothetical protein